MSSTDMQRSDIVILGGGLAGLTLAIQLKRQDPGIGIVVLERRTHPVEEAAFKVGESTVEIGARYFAHVLGLREHLEREHIRKFGFRFFFSEGRSDLDRCTELGVSQPLPTPSWQIDRGRFENFLGTHARALGIDFRDGATVRGIELGSGDGDHQVRYEHADGSTEIAARWLVDASGRAGLLKRKLGLAQPNAHDVNSAWWRVEGHVDPAQWSRDPQWLSRCDPPERWRSTNHMVGPGYWFWMIPLSSGAHSLGIVADEAAHPLAGINSHDKAMAWLREHQPGVAAQLDDPRHRLRDFLFLRHFSYGCKQVFSGDRWALTGEAGLFLDPFYSPGSDFIAIANGYIADLVARDRAGQPFAPYAGIWEQVFQGFYANTMTLYQDQYPIFGDEWLLPIKVTWDYTYYWALLAPLYYADKLTDAPFLGRMRPLFEDGRALNLAVQPLLRDWCARNAAAGMDAPADPPRPMLDQYPVDWFHELNRALSDPLDDAALFARMQANVARMRWLAARILQWARKAHPDIADHGLEALLAAQPAVPEDLSQQWFEAAA